MDMVNAKELLRSVPGILDKDLDAADWQRTSSANAIRCTVAGKKPFIKSGDSIEANFYRHVAPRFPAELLPECLHIVDDSLVLEDLSDTHQLGSPPGIPFPPDRYQRYLEAQARLHALTALWPDRAELMAQVGEPFVRVSNLRAGYQEVLPLVLEGYGDCLARVERDQLEAIAAAEFEPHFFGPECIFNGHAHFANVMFSESDLRLIDWNQVQVGMGEVAVAYSLGASVGQAYRDENEMRLLQAYARALNEHGLELEFDVVFERYRWCLLLNVFKLTCRSRWVGDFALWFQTLVQCLACIRSHGAMELLR